MGHPCEADLVAAGDSCLEGRLGQKIGSDIVTVVDDPTLRGYGAYPVDDEGVDAREKMLIRNGVLTEYLNHRRPPVGLTSNRTLEPAHRTAFTIRWCGCPTP